ncbi:MAG: hypothetical protein WBX25_34810 [Rhodomicrobium sp.]
MPKQVQSPDDGSILEFPDDMTDDEILGVMRKQFPPLPVDAATAYGGGSGEATLSPEDIAKGNVRMSEVAKGVPIAGSYVTQTPEMTQYEQEHPYSAAAYNLSGGAGAMALTGGLGSMLLPESLTAALPSVSNAGKAIYSALGYGTLAGTDQSLRETIGKEHGQPVPNPSQLLNYAHLPSTGSGPVDAALTTAALSYPAGVIGNKVGGFFAPAMSPAAKTLSDKGVDLSLGQSTGGALNTVEKLGSAFPLSGMENMRAGAMPQFNRGAENMALDKLNVPAFKGTEVNTSVPETYPQGHPLAGQTIDPGFAGREFVRNNIQKAYDVTLNGSYNLGEKPPVLTINPFILETRLKAIPQGFAGVKPESVDTFNNIMDRSVLSRLTPSTTTAWPGYTQLSGDAIQNINQELDKLGARFIQRGGDGFDIADGLKQAKETILQSLQSKKPVVAERLTAANKAWQSYAELRAAGKLTAAQSGVEGQFTPQQLAQGSFNADRSTNKVLSSEGRTTYGPYARAGMTVGISPAKSSQMAQLEALGGYIAGGAYYNPAFAAYPAMWGYSSPMFQALARGNMKNVAPYTRPIINQNVSRAGVMSTIPSIHQGVANALTGPDQQ